MSAQLGAGPDRRSLHGRSPLDDHVRGLELEPGIEQPPQDCGRTVERQVRHDLERIPGQRNTEGVAFDDVPKAAAQAGGQLRVDLDRDGAGARTHQRAGQCTAPGTEIEDEVVAPDSGSANYLRCKLATAEKVPAASAM